MWAAAAAPITCHSARRCQARSSVSSIAASLAAVARKPCAASRMISAVRNEQFSLVCAGLIVLQMQFLTADRPLSAAACWTMAMLKPQIALPFAALFLLHRGTLARAGGMVALVLLSLAACWWTEVSPAIILDHWLNRMSMRFIDEGFLFGPSGLSRLSGLDHRIGLTLAVVTAVSAVFGIALLMRRLPDTQFLPTAAACAIAGMFMCYHRHYDNVMLFPALLLAVEAAIRTPSRFKVVVAVAFMASLVIPLPMRLLHAAPAWQFVVAPI